MTSTKLTTPSFWQTFFAALKASFLSRDTFVIFAGAVAFYLIFYAWPYGNQQVQNVPTAVLDLDQSGASRHLTAAIDATPAAALVRRVTDEGVALDEFRREAFSVLITIPKGYERDLARGDNVTIHVLGNGAFPVKARAVQAALSAVVTDQAKKLDQRAVYATGLPGASIATHHDAPPALRIQYRYNEIGGYGNYSVPVVAPIILQAVMLMAVTMAMGGWLSAKVRYPFVEGVLAHPVRRGIALWAAFMTISFLWFTYMQGFDFWLHEYGTMLNVSATLTTGLLFSAAVSAFAMALTALLGSNRWSSQAVVMISAPAVFLSGGVWPVTNMLSAPVFGFSLLLPTSAAVPALLAASQGGATGSNMLAWWGILAAQTFLYLFLTALMLKYRSRMAPAED